MKYYVSLGERRVGRAEGMFAVLGLGSCVVIVLYDPASSVGGMSHVLLPDPSYNDNAARRWRYATTAVPGLLDEVVSAGGSKANITARLVGGASMFGELLPKGEPNIGERNVEAARSALKEAGIPLVGEDVGGDYGRSVYFKLSDGRLRVKAHGREHVEV
jgi:chemotaxis protein CheD